MHLYKTLDIKSSLFKGKLQLSRRYSKYTDNYCDGYSNIYYIGEGINFY